MSARHFSIIFAILFIAGSNFVLPPTQLPTRYFMSFAFAQGADTPLSEEVEKAYSNGLAAMQAGDPQMAKEIWESLALRGSAKAQYSLGLLLETGQGSVQPDIKKSVRYYAMAADAGIAEAQTNLGLLYAQGRGVNANPTLAAKYWTKSASAGHSMALFNLGLAYYQGAGVRADDQEAVALMYRASMQNLKEAQYALGQFYRNGIGITQSDEEALYWYRLSARQGNADADVAAKELKAEGVKSRGAPTPSLRPREATIFATQGTAQGIAQGTASEPTPVEATLQDLITPSRAKPAKPTPVATTPKAQPELQPEAPVTTPATIITQDEDLPILPSLNDDLLDEPMFVEDAPTAKPTRQSTQRPATSVASRTPQRSDNSQRSAPRQVLMLTETEAEIVYREALVLMQNPDGDRLSNGLHAADKILASAMAGNARAQRSLGEMYLLGVDIRRNEQQSLYWLREAERNGINDINGFADALELLGYSEPSRPNVNPQFN